VQLFTLQIKLNEKLQIIMADFSKPCTCSTKSKTGFAFEVFVLWEITLNQSVDFLLAAK